MGQYYRPVNLDKQEFLSSYNYGSGAKLTEHSWLLNPMVNAVMLALTPRGLWHLDRLVWAGDYMDDGLFMKQIKGKTRNDSNLYSCCRYDDDNGHKPCIRQIRLGFPDGPEPTLIVNHTNKEYVLLTGLPEEDPSDPGWHLHPLPLLTCSGNGRGGGDFNGDNPYVGTWAGHRISSAYAAPKGFRQIIPDFSERTH